MVALGCFWRHITTTQITFDQLARSFGGVPVATSTSCLNDENGLDMEVILMQSSIVPAALTRGDIDYQAGVGPASVNATLSGFATRAIWFSSDKISYWLMARPQFKTLESLKSRKIAITGLGGTVHVAFNLAMEKAGANPRDYVLVSIPGQQIQ